MPWGVREREIERERARERGRDGAARGRGVWTTRRGVRRQGDMRCRRAGGRASPRRAFFFYLVRSALVPTRARATNRTRCVALHHSPPLCAHGISRGCPGIARASAERETRREKKKKIGGCLPWDQHGDTRAPSPALQPLHPPLLPHPRGGQVRVFHLGTC